MSPHTSVVNNSTVYKHINLLCCFAYDHHKIQYDNIQNIQNKEPSSKGEVPQETTSTTENEQ
jgi:hypothetical protein